MTRYEYKVVPASFGDLPADDGQTKPQFYQQLEKLMNSMGAGGWTYQRAEILPIAEAQDQTRSVFLVFRRRTTLRQANAPANPLAPLLLERKMLASAKARRRACVTGSQSEPPQAKKLVVASPALADASALAATPIQSLQQKSQAMDAPTPNMDLHLHGAEQPLSLADFAAPALDLSFWQQPMHPENSQNELATRPSTEATPHATANDPAEEIAPGPALRFRAAQVRARKTKTNDK